MVARARSDTIRRLEPLLEHFFEHEWVAGVSVRLRFFPGAEDRELRIPWPGNKFLLRLRLLPWREQECPARWGAPITVTVSKKSQEGAPKTVRFMSLFIGGEGDMRHYVILTVVIFGGLLAFDAYKFGGRNRQAAWEDISSVWQQAGDLGRNFSDEVQRRLNAAMSGR
jgi:hypothetical protein